MTRARLSLLAGIGGLVLFGACAPADGPDKPFHKELLQVAKDYKAWGRVDDEVRFAPELCRLPNPGVARFSASKDEDTHGQKLYSLFARDQWAYMRLDAKKEAAVGQTIVKESWVPEETTDVGPGGIDSKKVVRTGDSPFKGDNFYPYATRGGKVFKASKPAGLFVMMKLDQKMPDTDGGWVYGTVSADGKTVTAAGKVESCMKCHQEAKTDRLFGLAGK